MKISKELAKRIVDRPIRPKRASLTEAQEVEILMEWLEGATYKQIGESRKLTQNVIARIIGNARKEAAKIMGNG